MIIKLTVNDNDFSEILERFAKNLTNRLLGLVHTVPEDASIDDKIQAHRDWQKTFDLLNPNTTPSLADNSEDALFLKTRMHKCWINFLKGTLDIDSEAKVYLENDLQTSIQSVYEDKWENGEAVYYFTKSNVVINQ